MKRFTFLNEHPCSLARLLDEGSAPHWQSFLLAGIVGVVLLTTSYGLLAYRVHVATVIDARAQGRLRASEAALSRSTHAWDDLRTTIRTAEHLRTLRLSGSLAVLQLVTIANQLPADVWLDSFSFSGQGLQIRGETKKLADIAHASDIVATISPLTQVQSVARQGRGETLTFEMRPKNTRL